MTFLRTSFERGHRWLVVPDNLERLGEGSNQLAARDVLMVNLEAGEDGLVEETTGSAFTMVVELLAVAEELQHDLKSLGHQGPVSCRLNQTSLSFGHLLADLLLSALELVDRDGICQICINEPGAVAFQLHQPRLLGTNSLLTALLEVVEGVLHAYSNDLTLLLAYGDGCPVTSHRSFHLGLIQVRQLAIGALLAASEAEEVAVPIAVPSS